MKNIYSVFNNFGLSDNEIALYISSLTLGEASMTELSSHSNIKRTTCYDLFKELKRKGLMGSYKIRSGLRYSATRPKAVISRFGEYAKDAKEVLPLLEGLYHTQELKQTVTHLVGPEGFFMAVKASLEIPGSTVYHFGSLKDMHMFFPKSYDETVYIPKRVSQKISLKALYIPTSEKYYPNPIDESIMREVRYLPTDFSYSGNKVIFGNTVVEAHISAGKVLTTITESSTIAQNERDTFDLLWKYCV